MSARSLSTVGVASLKQTVVPKRLVCRVLHRLRRCFDARGVLDMLEHATGGEFYIFGGTVRRVLFGDTRSGDLDLMVPNGGSRAFEALNALQVPVELNRSGHHRYHWNALQIDVFQPREFYRGFQDVDAALRFFDLRINALAVHPRTGLILDPFDVLLQSTVSDPGINWCRWDEMHLLDLTVLAIRLLKIMYETPTLTISRADSLRLEEDVLPRIRRVEWDQVRQRFPLGKEVFFEMFEINVLRRARNLLPRAPSKVAQTR